MKDKKIKYIILISSSIILLAISIGLVVLYNNNNIINAKYISEKAEEAYGKLITNYDTNQTTKVKWKIFHSDGENIYLIADDYIPYELIPNSTKEGTSTENRPSLLEEPLGVTFPNAVTLSNVVDDYDGEHVNNQVVAYMLDKTAWKSFAKETAEYAIGGPTIEMLIDSYNKKYGTNYQYKTEESLQKDDLYVKERPATADAMWISSPSDKAIDLNVAIYSDGTVGYDLFSDSVSGFRPVVCLKAETRLALQEDGTYIIK